ncbi:MAG: UDP-N-acetylmuramoyl-L-alanyl-D-glutamate--2,6-diaminopimelate ligase [Gemmatimonadota bacterium]
MTEPPRKLDGALHVLRTAGLLDESRGTGDVSVWKETYVSGASQDSRTTAAGDLFLAWQGVERDAHAFVQEAASAGARAAVVERRVPDTGIPQLVVTDGRRAGALLANWVFGSPWKELFLVGVTGTNGKTTTSLLARHLLSRQRNSAALGTLGLMGPDGTLRPGGSGLTTPGPVDLARSLRALVEEGVEAVVMEASSHALQQCRLDGVRFDAVVFTNLSQDHLDYHPDLASYREAKLHLTTLRKDGGVTVLNGDDGQWARVAREMPGAWVTTQGGGQEAPDWLSSREGVRASHVQLDAQGARFHLHHGGQTEEVSLPLPGGFNVENALLAGAVALIAGSSLTEVAQGLSRAPQIPGRMEVVSRSPVLTLVDYAHTPDALDRVLSTLRPLVTGRLIVVFGAGGDRDRTKRPAMGLAAARWADRVVVTSDNPRTEDPETILEDIVQGIPQAATQTVLRIVDRREAIRRALDDARPQDAVLVAGKGHETAQVVGTERRPFDDRMVLRELLGVGGGVT